MIFHLWHQKWSTFVNIERFVFASEVCPDVLGARFIRMRIRLPLNHVRLSPTYVSCPSPINQTLHVHTHPRLSLVYAIMCQWSEAAADVTFLVQNHNRSVRMQVTAYLTVTK
jgi:hypothetical protein